VSRREITASVVAAVTAAAVVAGCGQGPAESVASAAGQSNHPTIAIDKTRAAIPPCSASLLFAAAVAAQHFSTDPAEYPPDPGQGPDAYDPVCDARWAIAAISHPQVGTTDGEALFRAKRGSWSFVSELGGVPADCILEQDGVSPGVARVLWPPSQSQPSSYCSQ
jgi:hypothetical protein